MNAPEDKISRKAYEMWEAEGRPHGRDREHWLMAQAELASEQVKPKVRRAASKTKTATRAKPKSGKA